MVALHHPTIFPVLQQSGHLKPGMITCCISYKPLKPVETSIKDIKVKCPLGYRIRERLLNFVDGHSRYSISMKRTRATTKTQQCNDDGSQEKADNATQSLGDSNPETRKAPKIVQLRNFQSEDLKKKLKTENEASFSKTGNVKNKINLKSLQQRQKRVDEELKPNAAPAKNKPRAVVDLNVMKAELKQLEDPPVSPWEKNLCSARLQYSFFDSPCEQLAQNLLGKVLVRCLENGTILKGRIVETEGYLGVIDKASHSYDNKVTQRNIPMYMPPGTIYVYMTYGMYHCFNISSQESGAHVQISAVEPLIGSEYMELLRNMQLEKNGKQKKIMKNTRRINRNELCNSPSKICTAFDINENDFNQKLIYESNNLWIENVDSCANTIVAAGTDPGISPEQSELTCRYYVLGNPCVPRRNTEFEEQAYIILGDGCAVLIRAVDPLEGIDHMTTSRNKKKKANGSNTASKSLKLHELCNGPSKLCMAFQLDKSHSKYSMCSWRGLWLENHSEEDEIKIVKSSRIGIDSCGPEWASKPLRYYIYGNKSVSKRDKKAEQLLTE